MPKEIELKLEITPAAADTLLASDLLAGPCREQTQHAIYYDTADRLLAKNGLTLRIRRTDGMAVQTVKAGAASAALFDRREWELPVVGKRPVADDRTPVAGLLGARFAELQPLFEVPVARRTCLLRVGDAEVELALDRAEIFAGERMTRFCEVELELVSGEPARLFDLARQIDAIAPARIGVLSKAERGYRLLGRLPESIRAEKTALDREADLPTAFATVASACLRQYSLNEAILLERPVPEAIHQARIGLRRLRSAMTLFRAMLTGAERAKLNARLRDLAGVLGDARDLDVLSAESEPGPLLDRLHEAREAAYAAMDRKLRAKETRRLPLDMAQWIADGAWRGDPATQALRETALPEFAASALDRLRRKVAKHGRHLASLDPEARHELRKDVKKLRYGVEFLASLFAKRGKFGKALESLQDSLGGLNDRAAAEDRLAKLGLTNTPEVDAFLAQWRIDGLLEDTAKARHDLLDARRFWR